MSKLNKTSPDEQLSEKAKKAVSSHAGGISPPGLQGCLKKVSKYSDSTKNNAERIYKRSERLISEIYQQLENNLPALSRQELKDILTALEETRKKAYGLSRVAADLHMFSDSETFKNSATFASTLSRVESSLNILCVATEWLPEHGGVSSFNRKLCIAMKKLGHNIFCAVLSVGTNDLRDAHKYGVTLLLSLKLFSAEESSTPPNHTNALFPLS